jgi:predicted glycosyltransferase involved in capsule biosynthesis
VPLKKNYRKLITLIKSLIKLLFRALGKLVSILDNRADDVTLVFGIRNRSDSRLRNALASIRQQKCYGTQVFPIVVDYGSSPSQVVLAQEICRLYEAKYIYVGNAEIWNRSHCLNIGIKNSNTKYIGISDVDIVFSPNYVEEALKVLKRHPFSVVVSNMLDLDKESTQKLNEDDKLTSSIFNLKRTASPRIINARKYDGFHPSIGFMPSYLLKLIRGYDETFKVWGFEDVDIYKRLMKLGVTYRKISEDAFYLHQWHPKHEGVKDENPEKVTEQNKMYFEQSNSIFRNPKGWGVIP